MNKNTVLIGLVLIFGVWTGLAAAAEVTYSITNDMKYSIFSGSERDSLQNSLDLTLNIDHLQLGLLFDTLQPLPNADYAAKKIGPVYLRKRFVDYSKGELSLRVGNFPVLFGRGLSVNLMRDDALYHDNEADGVKVTYQGDYGEGILFSANVPKYNSLPYALGYETIDEASHLFRGGMFNFKAKSLFPELPVVNRLKMGAHYVRFRAHETNDMESRRQLWGGLLTYTSDQLDGYFEAVTGEKYEIDRDDNEYDQSENIRLLYGSLIGYAADFSLSADWKDFRDFSFADAGQKLYNNPPTLRYQHTSKLLGRHLFQENLLAAGEDGYKIEGNFSPSYATSFTANYTRVNNRRTDDQIFEEYYLKGEHEFSDMFILQGMVSQNEHAKGDFLGGWLLGTYSFESGRTLSATLELVQDDEYDYTEHYTSVTFAPNSSWNFTLSVEGTDEDGAVDRSTRMFGDELDFDGWLALEMSYRYKTHLLQVFLGERREGWNCNGSVCSYQPPFSGLEVQLISVF